MGKPRYTRKYPTYPKIPEIPENKRDTRKYPIIYFNTPTRPEPDPLPVILFNTRPDPTWYWKTLPAGHWSWREKWSSDDNDILINTGRFVAKCSNHTCPCRDHQGHTWSLQQTTKSWGNLSHRQWCRKKIADASINGNIIGALKNIDIIDDAKKRETWLMT